MPATAVVVDVELEVRGQFLVERALARRSAEGIDQAQQERAQRSHDAGFLR